MISCVRGEWWILGAETKIVSRDLDSNLTRTSSRRSGSSLLSKIPGSYVLIQSQKQLLIVNFSECFSLLFAGFPPPASCIIV